MESENETVKGRESFEVPGVGEILARPGTSTAELAGAVKYWHTKATEAYANGLEVGKSLGRRDGASTVIMLVGILELGAAIILCAL